MDEAVWEEMRERLMALTTKQLRQVAREEGITLGYAASRKDTTVAEIVSQRRSRALRGEVVTTGEKVDGYRRFAFSPNGIYAKGDANDRNREATRVRGGHQPSHHGLRGNEDGV